MKQSKRVKTVLVWRTGRRGACIKVPTNLISGILVSSMLTPTAGLPKAFIQTADSIKSSHPLTLCFLLLEARVDGIKDLRL